jgi:UrcA family protein
MCLARMGFDCSRERLVHTFRYRILGKVVAYILCGASGLGNAEPPPAGVVVKFADLNLNTHDGVATLYARLEAAALRACTAHEGTPSGAEFNSCIDYNIRQAVAEIRAPRLVMLYETRSGHALPPVRR